MGQQTACILLAGYSLCSIACGRYDSNSQVVGEQPVVASSGGRSGRMTRAPRSSARGRVRAVCARTCCVPRAWRPEDIYVCCTALAPPGNRSLDQREGQLLTQARLLHQAFRE